MKRTAWLLILTLYALTSFAEIVSGDFLGVSWSLDTETGVLALRSSDGNSCNGDWGSYPWLRYNDKISTVEMYIEMEGYAPHFSIGEGMFYECKNLTKVNIPYAVSSIGYKAFADCGKLQTIVFGDIDEANKAKGQQNMMPAAQYDLEIGNGAFCSCSSLESIDLPYYVTRLGDEAFRDCKNLAAVTLNLPEHVYTETSIALGKSVFEGCSALNTIGILENTTSLGNRLFANCESLTQITIPSNIEKVADDAFVGCKNLTTVRWNTAIESEAFWDNETIQEVIFGDDVQIIFPIFAGCINLEKVLTGNQLAEITTEAFVDTGIKEFYLKNNYVWVMSEAFPETPSTDAVLYAPDIEKYSNKPALSYFARMENMQACEPPIITVEDNVLTVTCGTEGAKCYYSLSTPDTAKERLIDAPVELYAKYSIHAYAQKDYYLDSGAGCIVYWVSDPGGDSDGVNAISADRRAILASTLGGEVTIKGLHDGEVIEMYDISGRSLATAKAKDGSATLAAKPGETVIIKLGDDAIKVIVR